MFQLNHTVDKPLKRYHCLKNTAAVLLGTALVCTALPSLAASDLAADDSFAEPAQPERFVVHAKVLKVTPIVTRTEISEPIETCRLVSTGTDYPPRRYRRAAIEPPHRVLRSIVGSLIGGAIGNQIGGGSGRKAATVAGAIAGAHIANRNPRRHNDAADYRRNDREVVEQCTQTQRTRQVESVDGYRVRYRYDRQTFTKVMDEHPGDTVAISARVSPSPSAYYQP